MYLLITFTSSTPARKSTRWTIQGQGSLRVSFRILPATQAKDCVTDYPFDNFCSWRGKIAFDSTVISSAFSEKKANKQNPILFPSKVEKAKMIL
jgi:hypothetical protein